MPVSRAFLKPHTVGALPQGDFEYIPEVSGYEADTLADLVSEMTIGQGIQAEDLDNYYVVEDIKYQVTVLKPVSGNKPAVLNYSALVWYIRVHRV